MQSLSEKVFFLEANLSIFKFQTQWSLALKKQKKKETMGGEGSPQNLLFFFDFFDFLNGFSMFWAWSIEFNKKSLLKSTFWQLCGSSELPGSFQ